MVDYPNGPHPPDPFRPPKKVKLLDGREVLAELTMHQGEGINAQPFESTKYLDLEFPPGIGAAVVLSLTFQLGKWGYNREKINTSIEVTPVFTEYYQKTMEEKMKLEAQIKNAFASVMQAVQDFELIDHDLRKYKEFLGYFRDVEIARRKIKEAEEKKDKEAIEKAKKEYLRAQHVIRAIFVDQVDAHTGEGLSMRSIAPRWPTVISDFMDLFDDDNDVNEVKKRLNISKAEAIILVTKNRLYNKWRNDFFTTVKQRYKNLRQLAVARQASINEYREQIAPLISRYKSIKDMRESAGGRQALQGIAFWRPDSQAFAIDSTEIWAWKPFTVKQEPFPMTRESYDSISLDEAGFNEEEIRLLKESNIDSIKPMPAVPVMDKFVRSVMYQIEEEYKIRMTALDVVKTINSISKNFSSPEMPGVAADPSNVDTAIRAAPRWEFSPYYIFLRIPVERFTMKLANGAMVDDVMFNGMQAFNSTQNIIIGRMLELEAMKRKTEREINILLGLVDQLPNKSYESIDKIVEQEYPDIFLSEEDLQTIEKEKKEKQKEEEKIKKMKERKEKLDASKKKIADFFDKLGLKFFWGYPGPYERFMFERLSKMMQRGPGIAFLEVDAWLKKQAGVPGYA